MVSLKAVEDQLKRSGNTFQIWGRAEVKELCNVLMDNEEIQVCLNGHYSGGFAMLCSTDQRILLVDKKPMFLTLEDLRYDMISEIQFSHRLLDATVRIYTPTTSLHFTSWNRAHLRKLTMGAQQHVMAIRQYHQQIDSMQQHQLKQQFQPQPVAEPDAQPAAQLSPLTMPHPSDASAEIPLNPALATVAAVPATESSLPGTATFNFGPTRGMNPFLKSPLVTRSRGGFRRW